MLWVRTEGRLKNGQYALYEHNETVYASTDVNGPRDVAENKPSRFWLCQFHGIVH